MQLFLFGGVFLLQNLRTFFRTYRKQLQTAGVFLLLGLAYFLLPCIFQKITGFACPGCGMTHLCMRLLRLDFAGAAGENLAAALLAPLWLAGILIRALWNPAWFSKGSRAENILLWGSVAVLLLFGVLRNLPGLEFLLPSYLR